MPDHDRYISTPEFNKLTEEYFDSRLKEANLTNKSDTADFKKKNKNKKTRTVAMPLNLILKNFLN